MFMDNSDVAHIRRNTLEYYQQQDVQEAILRVYPDEREFACRYVDTFGRRPEIIQYPNDIGALAKRGVTSFHLSIERWRFPQCLRKGITKSKLDDLRIGWDLVIDLDSDDFECCTEACAVFVEVLREAGLQNPFVKFSGNKGWHIIVPYEWFPPSIRGKPTSRLFPSAAASILDILSERARARLDNAFAAILPSSKYDDVGRDLYRIVEVDRQVARSRHLIRASYSLHEKSGLVSVPVDADDVRRFRRSDAEPSCVKVNPDWYPWKLPEDDRGGGEELLEEAVMLVEEKHSRTSALRASPRCIEDMGKDYYPPCILNILHGLSDGRKRSIFLLVGFFKSIGLPWDEVKARIRKWNAKNKPPLQEADLESPLRYLESKKDDYTMANCDHPAYFKAMGVCRSDTTCIRIRNPLTYSQRKKRRELLDYDQRGGSRTPNKEGGEPDQASPSRSTRGDDNEEHEVGGRGNG